jgi:hypothetical protein
MAKKKPKPGLSQEEKTRQYFDREREEYEQRTNTIVRYPDTVEFPDNGDRAVKPEEEIAADGVESADQGEKEDENQSETEGEN